MDESESSPNSAASIPRLEQRHNGQDVVDALGEVEALLGPFDQWRDLDELAADLRWLVSGGAPVRHPKD